MIPTHRLADSDGNDSGRLESSTPQQAIIVSDCCSENVQQHTHDIRYHDDDR